MQTKENVCLCFDYCPGGDLSGLVNSFSPPRLPRALLQKVLAQLSYATGHLHLIGILHRDLRMSNIMLSANGNVKIGDFSSAAVVKPLDAEGGSDRFDPYR